jgi:hypothetical protein
VNVADIKASAAGAHCALEPFHAPADFINNVAPGGNGA